MKTMLYIIGFFFVLIGIFIFLSILNPIFALIVEIVVLLGIAYIAFINWGGILVSAGKLDQAKKVLDHKIQHNPRNALAHTQRASLNFCLNNFDGALQDYKTALDLDITRLERWTINKGIEATIYTEIGQVYFAQKNYQDALENFNRAYQLKPTFHPAQAWLGITYYALINLSQAQEWWQLACNNYPPYRLLDGTKWVKNQIGWAECEIDDAKRIFTLLNAGI